LNRLAFIIFLGLNKPWVLFFRKRMDIYIASDHAGFSLKGHLLENVGVPLLDLGVDSVQNCDYPIFAAKLAAKVLETNGMGILICGSGIGMSIAANRHKYIRAALCWSEQAAKMSRQHNDANVLVLGARMIDGQTALRCVRIFLDTKFDGGRHNLRLSMIDRGEDT
jgi:ribose 5-phosphate isomerase B